AAPGGGARRLGLVAAAAAAVGGRGGVAGAAVAARHPAPSLVSIWWLGRPGRGQARPATEFTVQAWAGSTAVRGTVERPPLAAGGRLGEWLAGGYAAIGALAATIGARRSGRGQHVDVSLLEVVHLSMAPFTTLIASFA